MISKITHILNINIFYFLSIERLKCQGNEMVTKCSCRTRRNLQFQKTSIYTCEGVEHNVCTFYRDKNSEGNSFTYFLVVNDGKWEKAIQSMGKKWFWINICFVISKNFWWYFKQYLKNLKQSLTHSGSEIKMCFPSSFPVFLGGIVMK